MKRMLVKTGVTLLGMLAVAALVLTGCEQPGSLSSDATLQSVTVAGVSAVSLGTPDTDWMAVIPGDIYLSDSQLKDVPINASVENGSDVWYAVGASGAQPWFEKSATLTMEHDNFIWIEVFSANLDAYLIYALKVHNRTPLLSEVSISSKFEAPPGTDFMGNPFIMSFTNIRSAKKLGTPATSWNAVTDTGELWVGTSEFAGNKPLGTSTTGITLTFAATPEMPGTGVSFTVAKGDEEPDFTKSVEVKNTANGDWLYVKTVSDDTTYGETVYYKIKLVEKNDDLTLKNATINGTDVSTSIGAIGYHSLVGQEAWGSYYNGAQLPAAATDLGADTSAAVVVSVTPAASATTVKYGVAANDLDYLAGQFNDGSNLGALAAGPHIIALEVTNELGEAAYYRFRILRGSNSATISGISITGSPSLPTPNTEAGGINLVDVIGSGFPISVTGSVSGVSSGAVISVGLADSKMAVPYVWTDGATINLTNVAIGNCVVIRVVAENGYSTNYYKIRYVLSGSSLADITGITIGSKTVTGASLGTPGILNPAMYNAFTGVPGTATLTSAAAGDGTAITVGVTGLSTNATVDYNWGANFWGANYPAGVWDTTGAGSVLFAGGSAFGGGATVAPGVDNALIFVRVTSENGAEVNVYAVSCHVTP